MPSNPFPMGNKIWMLRSSAGPKPVFAGPDELWKACVEYFEWVEENPLYEAKAFAYEGVVTVEKLPKMRAMTISGLCLFLDVDRRTWSLWREERADLLPVLTRCEEIIRTQKFEGAAADLLNPNIIARDLGLANREELTGPNGGPIEIQNVAADEAKRKLLAITAEGEG